MIKLSFMVESASDAAGRSGSVGDWTCQEWAIGGTRGSPGPKVQQEIKDDAVIELELDQGEVLFLCPDQLGDYGFQASRSGDPIDIGPSISFPGIGSRDGISTRALRALRLWRNPAGAAMEVLAGALQDWSLGKDTKGTTAQGWYRFGEHATRLAPGVATSSSPALLLIHGTMSSTSGSFIGLMQGNPLERLRKRYGDAIYGFEHRTLTESPLTNAVALLSGLPVGLTADVICYSRGGLVAELLVRALDGGISQPEIDMFCEQLGQDQARAQFSELSRLAAEKRLTIRRMVRVAAPMRGTTLLSGRLDRWATTVFDLTSKALKLSGRPDWAQGVALAKAFLLELTRQRSVPDVLPGLESMRPESPWAPLLNPARLDAARREIDLPTFVIAGDYQGQRVLSWIADRFSDRFYGGGNDFVVNTVSMTGGAHRKGGVYRKLFRDGDTHHLNYFKRDVVQARILDALERGPDAQDFERMAREETAVARGGRKPKLRPEGPIAILLPGITGSHLEVGSDRIWMQVYELLFGGVRKLHIHANNVTPDGWIDSYYEDFAEYLNQTHEVRPFAYDWRLSIADSGRQLKAELIKAFDEAARRKQPVHIFAHSMGGLVARWALGPEGLWPRMEEHQHSRLVMLGTPNQGSHSIPYLLMGREKTLRMLERLDVRHDARDLVDLFRHFPGVLQLMPFGGATGSDFFQPEYWRQVSSALGDKSPWPVPTDDALRASETVLRNLANHTLKDRPLIYVAGHNADEGTISAVSTGKPPKAEISLRGDGRVLWSTGIPEGVATYYVAVTHGDLARHEQAFAGYRELAERGNTSSIHLSKSPPGTGEVRGFVSSRAGATDPGESLLLFPTEEEILAAATGGSSRPLEARMRTDSPIVRFEVIHGSIEPAKGAVLVGRCEGDTELTGAIRFLDRQAGGMLKKSLDLNDLGSADDTVRIIGSADTGTTAVVVYLGRIGELTPGILRQRVEKALVRLVLDASARSASDTSVIVDVNTVLLGSGLYGLSIGTVVGALAEAAGDAQVSLAQCQQGSFEARAIGQLGTVKILEIDEVRANQAALALSGLARGKLRDRITFQERIHAGEAGCRSYLADTDLTGDAQRIVIRAPYGIEAGLEFTAITRSARNAYLREPAQGRFATQMLELAMGSTHDHPGLSRALFELLTPNDFKPLVGNFDGVVLSVDEPAANIPWELFRDPHRTERPLATRVKMVRQLIRSPRTNTPRSPLRKAVVIGDSKADRLLYGVLTGARAEMRAVNALLNEHRISSVPYEEIASLDFLQTLLTEDVGLLHIAAHGDWTEVEDRFPSGGGDAVRRYAGVVLENGLLLTSLQIEKLPRVPELVFLNCCHLGDTRVDAQRNARWPELAASLAVAFLDRGCKVVVAAGWAVHDSAAQCFATEFYRSLLAGEKLGEAVRSARAATFERYPTHNTWGAYQVYGDDGYLLRIPEAQASPPASDEPIFSKLRALDLLAAVAAGKRPSKPSGAVAALANRLSEDLRKDVEVQFALARAYQHALDRTSAIAHWREALANESAMVPLRDVEQLANAEVREAIELARKWEKQNTTTDAPEYQASLAMLNQGESRLIALCQLAGETGERWGLRGSAAKREAWLQALAGLDPLAAIDRSRNAYQRQMKIADALPPEVDFYPANNLAHLHWLVHALAGTLDKQVAAFIGDLGRRAQLNAERRQLRGDFWAYAAIFDCAMTLALAKECSSSAPDPDTAQRLLDATAPARIDLQNRFPDSYKNASLEEQLGFFVALFRWGAHKKKPAASRWQTVFETVLASIASSNSGPHAGTQSNGANNASASAAKPRPSAAKSSPGVTKPPKQTPRKGGKPKKG